MKDVAALNNFNKALQNMSKREAFDTYMSSASMAAQNFAKEMHTSGLSVSDFIKQAKMLEVSMAAQNKSLANVKILFNEYNSGCKNTGLTQQDFAKAVGESNKSAGAYLSNLNGGQATMRGYIGSLISAKAATIGLQVATIALNMAVTALISLAVSKFIENVIQKNERLKESAEKAVNAYKDSQSTLKSNKETIEEISSDYEKLSKGVDKFGNNISLSTSEYKRYNEITNKIADMFPEMVRGYNDEGVAILNTTGKVEDLTRAYEEKAKAAKLSYLQDADTIYQSDKAQVNEGDKLFGKDGITQLKKLRAARTVLAMENGILGQDYEVAKAIMTEAGYTINGNESKEELNKIFASNSSLMKVYLNQQQALMDSYLNNARSSLSNHLELVDQSYQGFSQNEKAMVQTIVGSLDDFYIFNDKFDTINDLYNDFHTKMVSLFSDENLKNEFNFVFNCQTKLNNGEATIGEYQNEINRLTDLMSDEHIDEDTQRLINISFGIDEEGLIQDKKNFENVVAQLVSTGLEESVARSVVGKLKLPEFKEMLNNGGQFKDSIKQWLQENQGATAAEFSEWLDGILSESANSISDSSSTILNAFSKASEAVTGFKTAMDESKGTVKSGTESFEGYADAYKKATELIDQGYDLDNGKLYAYMEFLLGKDTLEKYGYNVNKLKDKLKGLKDVFGNSDKLGNGFLSLLKDTVGKDGKLLNDAGETIAEYYKKTGEWSIDNEHFGEVADALGMTEDGLVSCIQAMSTWSNVALESLEEIKERAEIAGAVYHEQLEGKDVVNVETLRSNMQANGYTDKQTYDAIQQLKKDKSVITIDVKADSSAKDLMGQFSKLGLIGDSGEEKPVLDLMDTIDVLKDTGDSLTDITDMITTLNDSGEISIKVNGETTDDLGALRDKIEELYNYSALGAERAQKKLLELGLTKANITFETGDWQLIDDYLGSAREVLNQFRKEDGTIDLTLEGAEEAQTVLIQLINEKQEYEKPAVMNIDTSQFDESQADIKNAIDKVQEFIDLKNQLELQTELGIDTTETQKALRSVATQIKDEIPDSVKTDLGLDTKEFDSAIATISGTKINVDTGLSISDESITSVTAAIKSIPTQNIKVGIDINEEDKVAEVKYNVDSSEVDAYKKKSDDKTATVTYHKVSTEVDRYDPKNLSRTVTYHVKTEGSVNANGTAHLSGTAKASGDWGAVTGGVSLLSELGTEIIVDPHTGRWYTVGENGAEFAYVPAGAIVFNHKQSEALLKYGHINSRGKALAGGTAYAGGKDNSTSPSVTLTSTSSSNSSSKSKSTTSKSSSKSTSTKSSSKSSSSSKKSSSSSTKDDSTDWIEVAISRIERAITNLGNKAKSVYSAVSTRLAAMSGEISKVNQEISIQQKAANRYMKQANSVGLSASLSKKVREGTIDINKYDESTQKLISSYKQWYEKSIACSDAVAKLKETLASLYKDKFDVIQKDYENQINVIGSTVNDFKGRISTIEAKGFLESASAYESLAKVQKRNVSALENELASLQQSFSEGMKSGQIAEYSEQWYAMRLQIDNVKESLTEAQNQLTTYSNTMRKIQWDHFDYMLERIDQISQEGSFLIELMSDMDLYDSKGQFNEYGEATLGLRSQDYRVFKEQSEKYAQQIAFINKSLADDPYNTTLLSRREELIKAQQQSIKSANDEKKAIQSLVKDGIDKELSSLKDLISAYTDELDNAKSLYEYQSKISDKTSNIASIQKQLSAYENDTSEESRTTIQKLKVELDKAQTDLADTQYEQSISDQKKLLDSMYNDYEETINKRLDDVDKLMVDMINAVNTNSSQINQTIQNVSGNVGYALSDSAKQIWGNNTNINKSVTAAVDSIHSNVFNMVQASNKVAQKKYATGGLIDYTGLAQVDGTKSKPELVLNAADTKNLLDLTSTLRQAPITYAGQEYAGYTNMIQHAIGLPNLSGKTSTIQNHTVNQDVNNNVTMNVNIDHVERYEEIFEKAKHDDRFEKFIKSMTTDRLVGGSKLAKYKQSWK